MKQNFNTSFAIILTLLSLGCSSKVEQRPNIIYIMSDDHAVQAISAYGSEISQLAPTPNLDRLADEGMLFRNAFVSNSICGPSRAAVLTGKYSHKNGYYKNEKGGPFNGDQMTFPKILQKNGYQTAMIGKWHLGSLPQGFDHYKVLVGQGFYYDPVYIENGNRVQEKGYVDDLSTDYALEWLDKRDPAQPFCLFFQPKAPHRPWDPATRNKELFNDFDFPVPPTFNDDYATRKAAKENAMSIEHHLNREDLKMTPPEGLTKRETRKWLSYGNNGEYLSPSDTLKGEALKYWKYQKYIKDYLRCIKHIDENVGRVLDYLDENNLTENTIVVYTSDQGFYLGEHGWFDKRWMYEESFKTPLLIRYPKTVKPQSVSEELVMNIDFAPTLLDYAQCEIPEDIQGESFMPVLENKPNNWRKAVYYHYYEFPYWHSVQPHYGVRDDRYKLIHYYYTMDNWELFDLRKDPTELNNVYDNPEYAQVVEMMKRKLKELQIHYEDTASIEEMREITTRAVKTVQVGYDLKE